jgi:hypothetical protein
VAVAEDLRLGSSRVRLTDPTDRPTAEVSPSSFCERRTSQLLKPLTLRRTARAEVKLKDLLLQYQLDRARETPPRRQPPPPPPPP